MMTQYVHSMGSSTIGIPTELYQLNRYRLVEKIQHENVEKGVVLLQGGTRSNMYDTDIHQEFRQESFFMWAFGVLDPGSYGAIDIETCSCYIFIYKFPDNYPLWKQPNHPLQHYRSKYGVNEVYYTYDMADVLRQLEPPVILTLGGCNPETQLPLTQATFPGIEAFTVDNTTLYPIIADLRVHKNLYEYEVMKYVIDVTAVGHKRLMRLAKPGKSEYLCECEFLNYIYGAGGCRFPSHRCVCASGPNTAYLDYENFTMANSQFIGDGDLCLFDMGASYFGYCSDVVSTFPANGKFTPQQKVIYEAVLDANRSVVRHMRPGVSWLEMHLLGSSKLLENLKSAGIVHGEVSDMVEAGVAGVFQPHGIGHLIGLDRNDVGGYVGSSSPRPHGDEGLEDLRTARVLEEGMFLTVGPGCYFIDELLNRALKNPNLSQFMEEEEIEKFRKFGGVCIRDNVYVHALGAVNMTKLPRSVEQVEDYMAGIDFEDSHLLMSQRVSSVRFFT